MKKVLTFDFNNMMSGMIGKDGITQEQIDKQLENAKNAHAKVTSTAGQGWQGWMDLPYNQDQIADDIIACANGVREKFDTFVVLGIGGSALGPSAVFNALRHLRYNDLPKEKRGGPKFYVEDNVDPERMASLLDVIDVEKTMFNVITKSGATSETMAQFLIIYDLLKSKLGDKANQHIIATTDQNKGNLIKIAKQEGFPTFYIPDGVGGRFSEFCPVGLLPAAVLGIDIKLMLQGAKDMDQMCRVDDVSKNPALFASLLMHIAMETGHNISVMMPYADSLRLISDWYCQLWAESLGKSVDYDGKLVYAGQTPVKALGVTDQHSQVQLYTEGPFDKVIVLLAVNNFRSTVDIPHGFADIPDVNFLCGSTMNKLINTEMEATEYALTKAGRLNMRITLDSVDEYSLGQLLYFFMLHTAYSGAMLNIDTYNQPGVEEGKKATYALFGKQGYEAKKQELDSAPKKDQKYII